MKRAMKRANNVSQYCEGKPLKIHRRKFPESKASFVNIDSCSSESTLADDITCFLDVNQAPAHLVGFWR